MKILKYLSIFVATMILLAVMAGGGLYFWAARDLPDFKRITDYQPSLVTTVLARDDRVLGYFYKEKRFLRSLDEMAPILPKAFLAAEDGGFYEHEGVDLPGIFRAAIKNLMAGGIVQGGSTITQQVIKSLLLTPERSYSRKIREAILAYRLEHYLNKEEILTIYLNQIYLGAGAYGVEAAAREYFGVHASDLTLAQAALLAGLPKAPSRYSPLKNPQRAVSRQHYVLSRLLDLGWISQEEYEQAGAEELEYKSMPDPSWTMGAYALEEVRRRLVQDYGEDMVYTGGLKVRASVDIEHQQAAEAALRHGLEASTKRRGWRGPVQHLEPEQVESFLAGQELDPQMLEPGARLQVVVTDVSAKGARVAFADRSGTMDVKTMGWARALDPSKAPEEVRKLKDATKILNKGDVLLASVVAPPEKSEGTWTMALEQEPVVEGALVSIDPTSGEVLALVGGYDFFRSQFNRATQAERQPGSAFKPIVYSVALDNGFTPASVVLDAPIVYDDQATNSTWKPQNFEGVFYGPTLLRTALVKSRNLVTIRLAQRVGIDAVIDRARALGLRADFPKDLSVSLGSAPVSLLNLCEAYTGFAREGTRIAPRLILSVADAWGNVLAESVPETSEALSPQTAYIVDSLLQQVVRFGTGWRAKALKRPVAGKTGTSNNEQDAWYMGFSPYLLTGVYVGFDQVQPMGKYETGSRAASPIWVEYRKAVEEKYPIQDFVRPSEIVMARIDAEKGLLAGPGTEKSLFLPFKAGTEPREVVQLPPPSSGQGSGGSASGAPASGEELLKQIF